VTIELKRCREADVDVLVAISVDTFVEAFGDQNTPENIEIYIQQSLTRDVLLAELRMAGSEFYLLVADSAVAGYLKINTGVAQSEAMGDAALEVERIYALAAFKGQGLGALMMNRAVAIAKERGLDTVWLGVWEHNDPARGFYRHLGFEQFGEHSFMLGTDPQTDLLMKLGI